MKKGNGYCKNHPEVVAIKGRNICKECRREENRQAAHKHRLTFKSEKGRKTQKFGTTLSGEGKRIPDSYFKLYDANNIITKETLKLSRVAVR